MNLHTDIPTRAQIDRLLNMRDGASVSIYLPTDPAGKGDKERIELRNLLDESLRQLEEAETSRSDLAAIEGAVRDLVDDTAFWRYGARTLRSSSRRKR